MSKLSLHIYNGLLHSAYISVVISLVVTCLAIPIPVYAQAGDNPNPPETMVKLIFIHHSTGENLLRDDYGELGKTLDANNYFVSDTNYGWGPNSIGDRTDIINWLEWFGPNRSDEVLNALYTESGQNSSYTRTLTDPGGENQIIMFKSCFPNSALAGNPDDPPAPGGDELTVSNAKYIYNTLLEYFITRPDKMFVLLTAPPLTSSEFANNARAFNNWLMQNWLANYKGKNVFVFDFYNILTGPNNHHRFVNGAVEYINNKGGNTEYYPSASDDDHPNQEGSLKATSEFVPLLNVFYHRWKASTKTAETSATATVAPSQEKTQPVLESSTSTSEVVTSTSESEPTETIEATVEEVQDVTEAEATELPVPTDTPASRKGLCPSAIGLPLFTIVITWAIRRQNRRSRVL